MSPEAQRIAIAEACGWKGPFENNDWEFPSKWFGINPDGYRQELPDYLNDLNAIHAAEKVLASMDGIDADDSGLVAHYQEALAAVIKCPLPLGQISGDVYWLQNFIHATAAQRCEAFLRTINKWEDSK